MHNIEKRRIVFYFQPPNTSSGVGRFRLNTKHDLVAHLSTLTQPSHHLITFQSVQLASDYFIVKMVGP